MITALCGGVGGSKLVLGLYRTLSPESLTVLVNTADDLDYCGLHVSPDLDTVVYTLAGLAQPQRGWGIAGDTFGALEMLERYGMPTWFQIGDRDLATHVYRTSRLRDGARLSEVTCEIARSLGVRAGILPMTDETVSTRLLVGPRWVHFQEYFVRRRHQDPVDAIEYQGAGAAKPVQRALEALRDADVVVLVNSNPVLSILPILSVPDMRDAIANRTGGRVAVSPLVGTDAVSGPAGDLMPLIGQRPTAAGVAATYQGLIDGIVIDRQDEVLVPEIEATGIRVHCTDIIMNTLEDRERLATEVVDFGRRLR